MAFDPLDPTTWRDDPDDFTVPVHETGSVAATTQADCDEEAHIRAFLGLDRWDTDEETKEEAVRQIMESRRAIHDALKSLQDAEAMLEEHDERAVQDAEDAKNMTADDVANELRQRAGWLDQEEALGDMKCPHCGGELVNPADWLSKPEGDDEE